MAANIDVFIRAALIFTIFLVKKQSFVSTDIVGLYIRPYDDLLNTQESFVYSSLYLYTSLLLKELRKIQMRRGMIRVIFLQQSSVHQSMMLISGAQRE